MIVLLAFFQSNAPDKMFLEHNQWAGDRRRWREMEAKKKRGGKWQKQSTLRNYKPLRWL